MSEWTIYILRKPVAMFMLITCKLYFLVWNKDHVNSRLPTELKKEILEKKSRKSWKEKNSIFSVNFQ